MVRRVLIIPLVFPILKYTNGEFKTDPSPRRLRNQWRFCDACAGSRSLATRAPQIAKVHVTECLQFEGSRMRPVEKTSRAN